MSIAKTNGMQTTNVNMYQTAALECCFWMLLLPASPAFATSYHQYMGFVHPNPSHPSLSSACFASCSTYSSRSFNILFMDEMDNDRFVSSRWAWSTVPAHYMSRHWPWDNSNALFAQIKEHPGCVSYHNMSYMSGVLRCICPISQGLPMTKSS